VRQSLLSILVLVGCAVDSGPSRTIEIVDDDNVVSIGPLTPDADLDVCALAAELPSGNICSLICEPSKMAERMVEDGSDRGTCYQLYCELPENEHVLVGVCLPP